MGLAVSQIRLLALTTRKADIELQMQIDSKRKQALTRKSTELSQQYYNKLKNTNIQYATNNGYEDVTFNYLMGQTSGEGYTTKFLQQVKNSSTKNNIAQKFVNNMILTDQYGQVVVNNEMAKVIAKTMDSYPVGMSNTERTAQAIVELINERRNDAFSDMFELYATDKVEHKLSTIDSTAKEKIVKYLMMFIQNGGFINGGKVYTPDNGSTYYSNALAAQQGDVTEKVILQKGATYIVSDEHGTVLNNLIGNLYTGGVGLSAFDEYLTQDQVEYLANIAAYFGPMISAALQNGITTKVTKTLTDGVEKPEQTYVEYENACGNPPTEAIEDWLLSNVLTNDGDICKYTDRSGNTSYYHNNHGTVEAYSSVSDISSYLKEPRMVPDLHNSDTRALLEMWLKNDGEWCCYTDASGQHYFKNVGGTVRSATSSECANTGDAVPGGINICEGGCFASTDQALLFLTQAGDVGIIQDPSTGVTTYIRYNGNGEYTHPYVQDGGAAEFFSNFTYFVDEGDNDKYIRASKVESLQAGFKAGTFQLCMVSDVTKGQYHKNTTMEYFTHMQYVVEKADSSMREEITAWFNTEQAALSEQETYWDTEIQNLSTELTAVNQEIDSVKSLKSNNIKSVFNWGGS